MRTGERKIRLVVIEDGRLPCIDGMTGKTRTGKLSCGMIRRLCGCVIFLMTRETIRIETFVPVIRVAG